MTKIKFGDKEYAIQFGYIATAKSLKNKLRNLKTPKDILSIARLIQLRKYQT